MKTSNLIRTSFRLGLLAAILSLFNVAQAQWVAFNDHAVGPGTAANTTRYIIPGSAGAGGTGSSGALQDITSGSPLPVTLTITTNGGTITYGTGSGAPPAGSPAYNVFNGYVDFNPANVTGASCQTEAGGLVTYTFTGLDVNKTYKFIGTHVRGGTAANNYTNRFEIYSIVGAGSYVNASPSPDTLTFSSATPGVNAGDIQPNQVVFTPCVNAGGTGVITNGVYAEWDSIVPGAGGTFSVTSARYGGSLPAPFSSTLNNPTYSYAITGMRLEEIAGSGLTAPTFAPTVPADVTALVGTTATFNGPASGNPAPTYQWYSNDVTHPISGATSSSYPLPNVQISASGSHYFVHAHNSQGDADSRLALLTVTNAPAGPGPIVFTNGTGLITFDTLPPVQQWSTRTITGANTAPSDFASLDAAAKTNDASTFVNALVSLTGAPPTDNGQGIWASAGLFIQTRPTGVAYSGIMATVSNASGSTLTSVGISYSNTIAAALAEQVPGQLVYWSTTGAPGSWTQIPGLSDAVNDAINGTYSKSAIVDLSSAPCFNGGKIYFLWVDDNANPSSPDTAVEIDNVQFTSTVVNPVAITVQPANTTVAQCATASFTVTATGGALHYAWYKGAGTGTPAPGATDNATYSIPNVQPGAAGSYHVVVSNSATPSGVDSSLASLTVTVAPPLNFVRAVAQTNGNILVSYSTQIDPASPSITQPTFQNTLIRLGPLSASDSTAITNAVLQNGTNILLQIDTLGVDSTNANNYAVQLSAVNGTCGQSAANVQHNVTSAQVYLVRIDATWHYNDSGVDPGPTWIQNSYNDTAAPWLTGRALFDGKTNGPRTTLNGITVNTTIAVTNTTTAYNSPGNDIPTYEFRTHFIFPGDPAAAGTVLLVRPDVDDAASFFINGQQAGTVGFTNPPVGLSVWTEDGSNYNCHTVGNANFEADGAVFATFGGGYISLPLTHVVRGDNVLAVELKQERGASSDIDMALELVATVPTVAPFLSSSRSGNTLTLTWATGQLQSSSTLGGPPSNWTPVSGGAATSPFSVSIPPSGTGKLFYRLVN